MSLPADVNTITITGTFTDSAGNPVGGVITFTPTAPLTNPAGTLVIPAVPRQYWLQGGKFTSDPLAATDNTVLSPSGWAFLVNISIENIPSYSYATFLPANPFSFTATSATPCVFTAAGSDYGAGSPVVLSGTVPAGFVSGTTYYVVSPSGTSFSLAATAGGSAIASTSTGTGVVHTAVTDMSTLEPVYPAGTVLGPAGYLPADGGTESGTIVLDGSPPLQVPGATAGQILMSDSSGNFTPQTDTATNATAIDGVTVTGTVATGRTIIVTGSGTASWQLPLQVDTTSSDIKGLGASAAWGTLQQAAAADHVHPITSALLDTTASDITTLGVQAAGSVGKAADAGHVHAAWTWVPADAGLLAVNFDPYSTQGAAGTMGAGVIYCLQVQIRYAFTWSNVAVMVTTAGSGTSTGCFAGLYSSGGTRLAQSADCASYLTGSAVVQYIPLTSPYTTTAGTFVWVALLCNLGTTQVSLGKNSIGNQGNVGYSIASNPAYLRAAKYTTTGQTSLPSSFTPSSALASPGEISFWVGAS